MSRQPFLATSAAALLVLSLVSPATAIDVVLHPTAVPQTRTVRLGDVATIQKAEGTVAKRLAELPLMPAPMAGHTHELTASEVRDFLAVLGEDVSDVRFRGAQRVTIGMDLNSSLGRLSLGQLPAQRQAISRTRRQELMTALKKLLLIHIAQQSGDQGPWECNIEENDSLVESLDRATTRPHVVGGEAPWENEQQFLVEFLDEQGEVRLPVRAQVSRQQAVIVAKMSIDADRLITRASVEMKYISSNDRRTLRRQPADSFDDVLGRVTTRTLRPGDTIYLDHVRAPLLVRRGETVQAVARGGGIEVRTYAKARNDGLPGDLIEIEPLHSKERIYGKVVGKGQVEVYAGGAALPASPVLSAARPHEPQGDL